MFRYKFFSLLLIIVTILSFNKTVYTFNELPLLNKIIYLDAGHGGVDPGAIYKNIEEKNINLQISLKLQKELEKLGATVYQTRYDDYDLSTTKNKRKKSDLTNRVSLINESNANMYISIHLNSDQSELWSGFQVFYDDVNKENEKIAKLMQEYVGKKLKSNREYKEIKNIYLNKNITIPGILVEVGFISNSNDRYLLITEEYQNKLAHLMATSISKYFN
jgi:N-acetylmuramoyl-L-alanine amidase